MEELRVVFTQNFRNAVFSPDLCSREQNVVFVIMKNVGTYRASYLPWLKLESLAVACCGEEATWQSAAARELIKGPWHMRISFQELLLTQEGLL